MNARKWKLMRKAIHFIPSLGLAVFSSISFSAYQYTYTGNTYTGKISYLEENAPEPYIAEQAFTGEIFIQFSSPTLLTGPINISDIDSFTMAGERFPKSERYFPYVKETLAYPGPFQNPWHEITGAGFNILSVNAYGLPTDWGIGISGVHGGTRHTYPTFSSTPYSDKVFGESEYNYNWTAHLNNNPGQWKVISVVPEPETYALLLAGLCVVGFAVRCRRIC